MKPEDLDRVMEIAQSLKPAPHWPRSAYLAALARDAAPRRIALVAGEPASGVGSPDDRSSSLGWKVGVPSDRSSSLGWKAGVPSDRSSSLGWIVAGFAVASLLPPQAELESIAVALAAQRQGLARRLFAVLADELQAAQVTEVLLEVRASNQPALGLYQRLGFAETGRRPRYYHDPVEDAVLMHLRF
jgi:ribosomal-protein-alanine N-acetyltransferase